MTSAIKQKLATGLPEEILDGQRRQEEARRWLRKANFAVKQVVVAGTSPAMTAR
jgi:hypothetical protein